MKSEDPKFDDVWKLIQEISNKNGESFQESDRLIAEGAWKKHTFQKIHSDYQEKIEYKGCEVVVGQGAELWKTINRLLREKQLLAPDDPKVTKPKFRKLAIKAYWARAEIRVK